LYCEALLPTRGARFYAINASLFCLEGALHASFEITFPIEVLLVKVWPIGEKAVDCRSAFLSVNVLAELQSPLFQRQNAHIETPRYFLDVSLLDFLSRMCKGILLGLSGSLSAHCPEAPYLFF
jgi:hypothetical protein